MIKPWIGNTKVLGPLKKLKHIYPTSLIAVSLGVLYVSLYFHYGQKDGYKETKEIYLSYQRELKNLEEDVEFLKQNQSHLNFLIKKSWFLPRSRLIAGTEIHQLGIPLNTLRFRIEPQVIKEMDEKFQFKVSRIIVETSTILDNHIYDFTKNTLKNFPGVLILRKLSVSRNMDVTPIKLLNLEQNKRPNFIIGELIFEWFSMGEKKDEE